MDSTKFFDPWTQVAEMQRWMASNFPAFKTAMDASPWRYQAADPTIAEIAVLATMHNLASTLRDPGEIKDAINRAIVERAKQLQAPNDPKS